MRVKRLGCKGVEVYPRGEVTRGRPEGMSRRIYRGGVSVVGVNRGGGGVYLPMELYYINRRLRVANLPSFNSKLTSPN